MRYAFRFLVFLTLHFISRSASAESFALVDVSQDAFGLGVGSMLGKGTLRPGFAVDAFHAYSFDKVRPDLEGYGLIEWTLPSEWLFIGQLGGGVTITDEKPLGSARALLVLTQTTPVAFHTSTFLMWTPKQDSFYVQQRVGPSIRLGDTSQRLFPWLSISLLSTDIRHPVVSPGCTYIAFF